MPYRHRGDLRVLDGLLDRPGKHVGESLWHIRLLTLSIRHISSNIAYTQKNLTVETLLDSEMLKRCLASNSDMQPLKRRVGGLNSFCNCTVSRKRLERRGKKAITSLI